jgi:hypothetical protein
VRTMETPRAEIDRSCTVIDRSCTALGDRE